jgi:Adenylate kinase
MVLTSAACAALLKEAMVKSGARTFLVDGFPRALDQARAFEVDVQPADAVLFFECSEAAMRARLLERGKTSGRADDNEETIVKRFRTFVEQSRPVVNEFKAQGKVIEVSSEQTPDEVRGRTRFWAAHCCGAACMAAIRWDFPARCVLCELRVPARGCVMGHACACRCSRRSRRLSTACWSRRARTERRVDSQPLAHVCARRVYFMPGLFLLPVNSTLPWRCSALFTLRLAAAEPHPTLHYR